MFLCQSFYPPGSHKSQVLRFGRINQQYKLHVMALSCLSLHSLAKTNFKEICGRGEGYLGKITTQHFASIYCCVRQFPFALNKLPIIWDAICDRNRENKISTLISYVINTCLIRQ